MSLDNTLQKSQKWASVLQSQVRNDSFIGMMIANTKFEGDFTGNGTINFRRQAKITVSTMTSGSSEIPVTKLVQTNETFNLTKYLGFAVEVSDQEFAETDIDPDSQVMQDAKEAFGRAFDLDVFGTYASAGLIVQDGDMETATNGGTTNPIIVTKANMYEVLRKVNLKMNKAVDSLGNKTGLPSKDRWVVVSPDEQYHIEGMPELLRSTELGDKLVTGGFSGTILGLKIYNTNLLSEVSTVRYCLFGQGKPISFGSNLKPKIQFVDSSTQANTFLNYLKGMTRYNSKVFAEGAERFGALKTKV